MYLNFGDFRYQIEQKLLYLNGELIPLKRNQAVLLSYFLSDIDVVRSKDDILNAVWPNQDVSEQVVFQTVSQLRSILGANAIKTLSKQGYKWVMPVEQDQLPHISTQADKAAHAPESLVKQPCIKQQHAFKVKWVIGLASLALVTLLLIVVLPTTSKDHAIALHLVATPQINDGFNIASVQKALSETDAFSASQSSSNILTTQAIAAPKLVREQQGISPEQWLVVLESFASDDKAALHYSLSKGQIHWQGYLYAESEQDLPIAFAKRMAELKDMGLFSQHLDKLDNASLEAMLNKRPLDSDIILKLAHYFEGIGHNDVSLSYLQKLVKLAPEHTSSDYVAQAHWKMGKIYKMRGQHLQAHNSLDRMSEALARTVVWPLYFQYVKTKAWLAYSEGDHAAMNRVLQQGLDYFYNASTRQSSNQARPLLQFKLHILYSILAQKTGDDKLKYHQLNLAQALLLKYGLDDSNKAVVYYHFALFAQQENQASNGLADDNGSSQQISVTYLERILALNRTTDNFWVQDAAFELLVKHYLGDGDFASALKQFDSRKLSPKWMLLKAEVLFAQNQAVQAKQLLESAFEQARIEYDTRTGIDAALKLHRLSTGDPVAQAEYLAYLESNANIEWLRDNLLAAND